MNRGSLDLLTQYQPYSRRESLSFNINLVHAERVSSFNTNHIDVEEARSSLNTTIIHEQRVSRSTHSIPTLCTQRESITQYQPCSCRESPSLNANPIHAERVTHSIPTLFTQRESLTQYQPCSCRESHLTQYQPYSCRESLLTQYQPYSFRESLLTQ